MRQSGNKIKDFNQYLGGLTQEFYPNQFIHTSGCTILANFTKHKIGKYIGSNQVFDQKSKQTTFPKVCLKAKQINTTIINCQRNFFVSEDKQLMNSSTVNFLYLLTVYAKVRIMVVITVEDIKDQKKNQLVYIFKQLSNIFKGKTQVQKRFGQCIGILVQDGAQFGMQKCISEMSKISNQLFQFSKNLLDNIIKNKKIVLSGPKKLLKDNLLQLKAIPEFQAAPKTLTQLYRQILIPEQLIYLQRIYKTYYSQPCTITLNILKQAFERKQIFDQNEIVRLDAIYNNFNMIPFNFQTPQDQKKREKKIDQFSCQSAYTILANLYTYQADLFQKDIKQGFIKYNLKNLDNQWNQNVLNLSIVGKIIQIVFSDLSIYHNPFLLKTANYLHSQFRFFENIPNIPIRQQQYNRIKDIQQLIRLLIQFFFENLNYAVQKLIKDSNKILSPRKLLNLTDDIKNLIKFLNNIKTIKRNPYKDIADDISNHLIIIVSSFFFCSWKCYEVYKNFWRRDQKNCFMIELYEICKHEEYKDYFQRMMIKPVHIFKRVNQYFGDLYAKKKQYYMSTKFYMAGRLNWKLIQNINLWLQKILEQQIYSMDDITQGITKLSNLGLGQQARKWCYKFMDKIDNNSQFISLLEDITNYQINQQKIVLEQISKLKNNQLNVVEDKYFNAIKSELSLEEWLISQL